MITQIKRLKVYELEPKRKHPVIFEWFDNLQPGESFIIENDHDPAPLYYELKAERKLGQFDYLQKGPDLWVVEISKASEPKQEFNSCTVQKTIPIAEPAFSSCSVPIQKPVDERRSSTDNTCVISEKKPVAKTEKLLDVPTLSPSLKHPTIFEWFHALEPGDTFTLKNDHDPKPLYYQMLGQLGKVFSWKYEEQGPDWWLVTIGKLLPEELTVGEIAAKDARKAEAMKKMGIDFCCGGGKSLQQAAADAGLSNEYLTSELNESDNISMDTRNNYSDWDAGFLADYIYNQHHKYYYDVRESILQLADKVKTVHGDRHPELIELYELVAELQYELNAHFYKEEKVLFPYIKELVASKKQGTLPTTQLDITQGPLAMMYMEHESAGEILKCIRILTKEYQLPDDACNSFRTLYTKLKDLESDLHQHIHLENNILFPKALELSRH